MSKSDHPYQPPPKWIDKLLERFCAPELLEEVLGDLHERYYLRVRREGVKKARRSYWREVLAYLRPSVFKRSQYHHSVNHKAMLKNYLRIALRNLAKHKVFSFINIVGLTVGISCCLLLFLYIQDELSYDQHHTHAPNLYRITTHFNNSGGMTEDLPTASPPIAMAMWSEFPEVVKATRVVSHPGIDFYQIYYQEKSFSEDKGLVVDSTFFEM
ncbi:MAG: permease prefix domain 2-containing transporter, partial [Bacteroidota bacterium]